MNRKKQPNEYVVFSPNLRADDDSANFWMRQATIRLRREICWLWQERGLNLPNNDQQLPVFIDKISASLDLTRHWAEKQRFWKEDVTAKYLTEQINAKPPSPKKNERGSFGWIINELKLDNVSALTLALGLTTAFDANMGNVIAACLNDASKIYPNLMLVQRLWDKPEDVLPLADPLHPLFGFGLLQTPSGASRFYSESLWEQPLTVPSLVARQLLSAENVSAEGLSELETDKIERAKLNDAGNLTANLLKAEKAEKLRVVALQGTKGAAFAETVASLSKKSGRGVLKYDGNIGLLENESYLNSLATLCWLQDKDFFINAEIFSETEKHRAVNEGLPLASLPVTVFLPITEHKQIKHLDSSIVFPTVKIPPLTFEERCEIWTKEFGKDARKYRRIIAEVSRRFRYEKEIIREICHGLKALKKDLSEEDFIAACRAELNFDMGELAIEILPRFREEKLILPNKQDLQFAEQLNAMRNLTEVHYGWGTAQAWNEGGITVLFAGPPGTGKTMAAEVMALKLNLPIFKVDLSQVVNKFVGETEKNLKRIFDAADISDMVLFFEEADSLFGKRTEVSDARDRYANLEISYLLERMERFKGLAILATNRKRDLDEAFLRRLRYIIDFPLPDEAERRKIWEQVIPPFAVKTELDFDFLARQFPMSGGNIRSVVFNACLQSAAAANGEKKLLMKDVLIAVKREYDKMNRAVSLEQFGQYAKNIDDLE